MHPCDGADDIVCLLLECQQVAELEPRSRVGCRPSILRDPDLPITETMGDHQGAHILDVAKVVGRVIVPSRTVAGKIGVEPVG